ncbi:DMT family transporter [Candidatus Hodarchaeum mangrovi]
METKLVHSYSALILAGVAFGTVPIFSAILRDLQVSSIEQSFMRLLIGFIAGGFLICKYIWDSPENVGLSGRFLHQKSYIIQGFLLSSALNCYLASIALNTPIGTAAFLIQIHPLVTFFLGYFLLNEKINKNKVLALFFALLGVIILTKPWEYSLFINSFPGVVLAGISGLSYGLYLIMGKLVQDQRSMIPQSISFGWILIWGFIMWFPFLIFSKTFLTAPQINFFNIWTYFNPLHLTFGICLGVIGNVIPFGLIIVAIKHVSSFKASVFLLIEPLAAIILATMVLQEPISVWYLLGGFFILIASFLMLKPYVSPPLTKSKEIILELP